MATPGVTEYVIRVPKNQKKKYQVMRFNSSLKIDFQKWTQVKIERENNMKDFKGPDDEQPKYGAGSEFGRDAREEARRKKFGIVSRKYKPEDQPWLMKVKQAGKTSAYKGVREGGIAENASYYVFTHAPDGAIDAYPLQEWYNFQPIHRYKALSAEEAEEEFGRRNKLMNYFSLMTRKRCRGKDDESELDDPDEAKAKKGGIKRKDLKISDMDEWVNSSDEEDSDSENENKDKDEEKDDKDKKKKQKDKAKTQKKKKKDFDSEAFEESDDGDEEGRELDYISDSSESESDHEGKARKELKGVAEEDALRKLLSSGSEDEEEKEDKDKEKEESDKEEADKTKDGEKQSPGKDGGERGEAGGKASAKKSKKKKKKKKLQQQKDLKAAKKEEACKRASSSDFSSDSATDSESEAKKKAKKEASGKGSSKDPKDVREKDGKDSASGGSSRSGTPTKEVGGDSKRKLSTTPDPTVASKKMRLDNFATAPYSSSPGIGSEAGITEDAVRRYLMRKPMTTTELLQKFKSKKTGLNSDQLVNIMTQILKRINPVKQTIKGKMYLSIKH